MSETNTPRVWIGCLACYNDGRLLGAWFDAVDCPTEVGDFDQQVSHEHPEHEELWVFDHENFGGLLRGECSPAHAQRLGEILASLELWQPLDAFAAFASNQGAATLDEVQSALGDFDDAYQGRWRSREEYAEELARDTSDTNFDELGWPLRYIDWERAARDLFLDGYWDADAGDGFIHVFRDV